MRSIVLERMEENPIIAAIRNYEDLDAALESQVTTIFLLHADIFNIKGFVDKIKQEGKSALIHVDFLEGIGRDNRAIDYISEVIRPDGIISTKSSNIKHAREIEVFSIQRFFLVDSLSFDTTIKTAQAMEPDMIEVMPGIMPSVLKRISRKLSVPIIAGGLIESKEDIFEILKAGAIGVSTGKKELWSL